MLQWLGFHIHVYSLSVPVSLRHDGLLSHVVYDKSNYKDTKKGTEYLMSSTTKILQHVESPKQTQTSSESMRRN